QTRIKFMRLVKLADSENDVGHTVYINHLLPSFFVRWLFLAASSGKNCWRKWWDTSTTILQFGRI
ncbi:MAG: hypothetical protein ACI8RT_000416, partial [Candidatus Azotimanducaceae bacterium]